MLHLKQSTTVTVNVGPFVDRIDGVSEETGLTLDVELSKEGGTFANRNSATAITHDVNGWYKVELNTTDTNTLGRLVLKAHDSANALPVWVEYMVMPANAYDSFYGSDKLDVNVEEWNATSVPAEHTAGYPIVTVKDGTGTGEIDTNAGAIVSVTTVGTVNALANGAITAAAIATGAIDADALATDAVTEIQAGLATSAEVAAVQADTDNIQTRLPAALVGGRMDSSVGAASAAGATALRAIATGTASGGSTNTLIDAGRTESSDHWNGMVILITSGANAGLARMIVGFNAASDTITFQQPVPNAIVTGVTYEILPAGPADVEAWHALHPNPLVVGLVDVNVTAMGSNTITAAAVATGAIDADALATDAVTEIQAGLATSAEVAAVQADTDNIQTRLPAALVGGRMDSSVGAMAANTVTASALATDAVNEVRDSILSDATPFAGSQIANLDAAVSTRATPADVNAQVLDVMTVDTFAEPGQGAPPATSTILQKLAYLFKAWRNKVTQDGTTYKLHADDGTTVDQKATVSDDGTTFTRDEVAGGP